MPFLQAGLLLFHHLVAHKGEHGKLCKELKVVAARELQRKSTCTAADWAHAEGSPDAEPDAPCLLVKISDRFGAPKEMSRKFFGWKNVVSPEDRKALLVDGGWKAFLRRWQKDMSTLVEVETSLIQDKMLTGCLQVFWGSNRLPTRVPTACRHAVHVGICFHPLTCWYAMRRTGLWSESDLQSERRRLQEASHAANPCGWC